MMYRVYVLVHQVFHHRGTSIEDCSNSRNLFLQGNIRNIQNRPKGRPNQNRFDLEVLSYSLHQNVQCNGILLDYSIICQVIHLDSNQDRQHLRPTTHPMDLLGQARRRFPNHLAFHRYQNRLLQDQLIQDWQNALELPLQVRISHRSFQEWQVKQVRPVVEIASAGHTHRDDFLQEPTNQQMIQ